MRNDQAVEASDPARRESLTDHLMHCGNLQLGLGGEGIFVTNPTHLSEVGQRPRSNSTADLLEKVKEAAIKNPIRSFIRAWVTINRVK